MADIVEVSSCVTVVDYAEEYFTECAIPELELLLIENLIMDLSGLFENPIYERPDYRTGGPFI